jgi:hypothetical protein
MSDLVTRYIELGLRLGRHVDGFVDAYYGPAEIAAAVAVEPLRAPAALAADAARLLTDLDAGADDATLGPDRRRWLRAQVIGLRTSARKLAGESIANVDEVEQCYGVRPRAVPDDVLAGAHRALESALPGSGPIAERLIAWREAQAVPVDKLRPAIESLAEDFRARTSDAFGLPDGEGVEFDLVTNEPWAGFNYYLGDLRSRVAINTDLPVLSPTLGHLVAHEAYPGHHTEHSRKEVGLVRQRQWDEETIFLVGTPQCLLAEGLADLGLEVICGDDNVRVVDAHLRPLGIRHDADLIPVVREASEALGAVRANVALLLHDEGASVDDAIAYAERWALLPRNRAEKMIEFLTDPTWRAYIHCYVDGLPLCRRYVSGDPARFERLITEQLLPADLEAAAA